MKVKLLLLAVSTAFSFASCNLSGNDDDDVLITRNDYLGGWSANEICTTNGDSYTMPISAGSGSNEILMDAFHGYGWIVTATVNGNNLTIIPQTTQFGELTGSGELDGDLLLINYIVGGNDCSLTATRQ